MAVIVTGPMACGKTYNAERLARHFNVPVAQEPDLFHYGRRPRAKILGTFLYFSTDSVDCLRKIYGESPRIVEFHELVAWGVVQANPARF